jgi:hypothetical protein
MSAQAIPRLGEGGVDATSRKYREASLAERTGRFVQPPIIPRVKQTTPSALRAAFPSFKRRALHNVRFLKTGQEKLFSAVF